jgi:hypothetical protein
VRIGTRLTSADEDPRDTGDDFNAVDGIAALPAGARCNP